MSQFYNHQTLPEEYYTAILNRLFPEIKINSLKKIHGYDSIVLVVNENRLFKIPQRKEVINQYLLEERLYPYIKSKLKIELPEIIEIRKGKQNFDEFVVEYKIMKGNHLTLEIEKHKFSNNQLVKIGKQIGKNLSQLHSLEVNDLVNLGIPKFDSKKWHEEYEFIQKNFLQFWNEDQQKWIKNLYENFLKIWDLQSFTPTLIHGDMGNWHIFSEKEYIIGFIDWGAVKIDDPAYDIRWHESQNEQDKIIGQAVLSHYNQIDPHFFDRTSFYNKRLPISKFIKSVQFNDEQRLKDGYILLENIMKYD
jgi:aminoglycoside 2''-phosphotransferase